MSTATSATATGRFGPYGGQYVPETLMPAIGELERAYFEVRDDAEFQAELSRLHRTYTGRPTPISFAQRLTEHCGGAQIYLKREDLAHTGAHKINNALGQGLLARRMGKRRIIAETGAGQHGVATRDGVRAAGPRVRRLHGHRRHGAPAAERLSHAAAGRRSAWCRHRLAHAQRRDQRGHARLGDQPRFLLPARLGAGAAPLPDDGARFSERDRARSARRRCWSSPDACPTWWSRASAAARTRSASFIRFLNDDRYELVGVEAGGRGIGVRRARRALCRRACPACCRARYSYVLQDDDGQIALTHSVSAGLDYACDRAGARAAARQRRAFYTYATDDEALGGVPGAVPHRGHHPGA